MLITCVKIRVTSPCQKLTPVMSKALTKESLVTSVMVGCDKLCRGNFLSHAREVKDGSKQGFGNEGDRNGEFIRNGFIGTS